MPAIQSKNRETTDTFNRPLKILQANINHSRDAFHLLRATAAELRVDVVAVSDPLWNPMGGGWEFGEVFSVAAWVTGFNGRRAMDNLTVRCQSHVAVVVEGLMVVACCLRPNQTRADLNDEIEELEQLR